MSKYLTIFNTEAQWQAAQDTLDYPNVSLIETTGDLYYTTYPGQEVANAPFGSIMMTEVATNKLFYIDNSDYNLTDYPFADFKPIAVCIYDKASNANNEAVFMSVQWMNATTLGYGSPSSAGMSWGFNGVDLSSKIQGLNDVGTNHVSSRVINNAMKPLITVDYSGTSYTGDTGDGSSAAFCTCWRYSTPGTNEGDWYLPSYYDLMKYQQNYSAINEVLTNIKTVAGTSYLNSVNDYQRASTSNNNNSSYIINNTGNFTTSNRTNNTSLRAVFIPHINEL